MKRRRKLRILAIAFLSALSLPPLLAGCDGAATEPPAAESGVPVAFEIAALPERTQTRVDDATADNLTSMGVFAYHTGQTDYGEATRFSYMPNYMYNQKVTRTNSSSPWTYTPVKYWPNKAGEKISFFAYAPHSSKCLTQYAHPLLTFPHASGEELPPQIYFIQPDISTDQIDLVASDFVLNATKGTAINFKMKHLLTKVEFRVKNGMGTAITMKYIGFQSGEEGWFIPAPFGGSWTLDDYYVNYSDVSTASDTSCPDGKTTTAGIFYVIPNNCENYLTFEITYNDGNGDQSKTLYFPGNPRDDWNMGEYWIYTLDMDKIKIDVTVTGGSGMTWGGSGTEEEINDTTPIS